MLSLKPHNIGRLRMFSCALLFIGIYLVAAMVVGVTVTLIVLTIHVVVIPLVFRFCKPFQRRLIFLNSVNWPPNTDFSEPSKSGVEGARNLYIQHDSKVNEGSIKIGIWHILPASALQRPGVKEPATEDQGTLFDEELATSGRPIVLYCHGNANNRAAKHRIKLYQVLQALDVHIIAFDYRGYGDSSGVSPTEPGVVEDTLVVYDWLRSAIEHSANPPPVFVWGHSLGTGISSHLLGNLDDLSAKYLGRSKGLPPPNGLILEAPFNNIYDEVSHHPLTKLVRWLPYFEATFARPFSGCADYEFRSERHLARVPLLPLLILHAKDDLIVPYELGVKLYEAVRASRAAGSGALALHSYERALGLGHKWICEASDLPQVVGQFMDSCAPKN